MHSLFLADDEIIIIRGLRKILDWPSLGIEIIGEATTGDQAERQILAIKPDIAILDIHMPLRTGLQILHTIREQEITTKVIFLSGYEEFPYVQEALRYGAKAFLTKPVKKDELIEVLQDTLKTIKSTNSTQKAMSKLSKLRQSPNNRLDEFFEDQQHFTVLACYICGLDLMEREMERLTVFSIYKTLESEVNGKKLGIAFTQKGVIYIILGHPEQGEYAYKIACQLADYIQRAAGKELIIGVGDTVSRIVEIRNSIESAQNALSYRFACPDERIFQTGNMPAGTEEISGGTEQMKQVMLYLTKNFAENISLMSMAKVVHMNPSYFSTVFKKNFGLNFKDCLTKIRMEKALSLLRNEDLRTYELAERVGFTDARYFSELFKKTYGKTPMEFKRDKKL